MKNAGDKLDLQEFVDLRPIVEHARDRGERHIKLPCSKYLLEGDLRYLQGIILGNASVLGRSLNSEQTRH